ncbi:DNA-binding transcriptional regulator NtrC [subsurface metagenome]
MTEGRGKVLVVDDEQTVRDVLKRTLEEAGYEVVTAGSGLEALERVCEQEIGVVLLDIKMPGMTGLEVLGKLTVDWPEICVIMVTAVADVQTAVKVMNLGAYDYITKPFNLDDVLLKMRRAIEKRDFQLRDKLLMQELQQSVKGQAERMQSQFEELVHSLAREHKMLHDLAAKQPGGGKSLLAKLPSELRETASSFDEFREALLRVLRGR